MGRRKKERALIVEPEESKENIEEICGDCIFCQNKNDSGRGECWRFPPILNGEHQQKQFVRPAVGLSEWCGEFERSLN